MTEAHKIDVGAPAPSALVLGAAAWLTGQNPPPEHPIPELQARFQLSAKEACEACRFADRLRIQRERVGNG